MNLVQQVKDEKDERDRNYMTWEEDHLMKKMLKAGMTHGDDIADDAVMPDEYYPRALINPIVKDKLGKEKVRNLDYDKIMAYMDAKMHKQTV